uniref:Uncharacterized protein n=1 Tax=Anguilla anguilla TaxID=7936 RepID=A0A0E9PDS4_ANGAN
MNKNFSVHLYSIQYIPQYKLYHAPPLN